MHFRTMLRYLSTILLAVSPSFGGGLRLGTAAVKITPPPGTPMSGYYYNRAAEGVHDDLYAKALVLEQDGSRAAIVACDLSGIPQAIVEEARRLVGNSAGLAGDRVMISATHTHTGPVIVAGRNRYNLSGTMADLGREYAAGLPAKIAESVRIAAASLKPARVSAGVGHEDSISFNRRFFMSDGTVGWNPGKLNPKIVRPAGPIDPEIPVVYFESPDSQPLATYVNFALHLDTVGGLQFSADYPYTLSKLLGEAKSSGMLTIFTIGAAGNVNHIDVSRKQRQKGHGEAARIGTILAADVLKTSKTLRPAPNGALQVRREIVRLPLPQIETGELEKARQTAATFGKPGAAPFLALVNAFKVIDVAERQGKPLEAEVQVITLGDELAWVGLPGEIFVELGLTIKKASPFRHTIVAELANGSIGYVPDRQAYSEGNYEVVSTRCGKGSGEMLVEAAVRLLRDAYSHSRAE